MGFIKEMDSLARQFLWAGSLSSSKLSLLKWNIVYIPKQLGGLGLGHSILFGMALAAKLYWRWCVEQDQLWAKILSHKYL